MCLEIARLQDFAPKYPRASVGLERPPDPLQPGARLAMRVDKPPFKIPAFGLLRIDTPLTFHLIFFIMFKFFFTHMAVYCIVY